MKPLLARSNSSPHSSTSYFKKVYRPSSISPCHPTHYQHGNENGHTNGVGGVGSIGSIGSVGGWLNRRGSVSDQRQGGHSGGGGSGQSRLTANSRNGSLVQQGNGGGKQLRAGSSFENKALKLPHATQKPTARELVEARKYRVAME